MTKKNKEQELKALGDQLEAAEDQLRGMMRSAMAADWCKAEWSLKFGRARRINELRDEIAVLKGWK